MLINKQIILKETPQGKLSNSHVMMDYNFPGSLGEPTRWAVGVPGFTISEPSQGSRRHALPWSCLYFLQGECRT